MSSAESLLSYLIRGGCITPTGLLHTEVGEVFMGEQGIMSGLVAVKALLSQATITILLDEALSKPRVNHGLLVVAREFPTIKNEGLIIRENPPLSSVTVFTNQRRADLWRGQKDVRPLFATVDV